jgi:hypothetical protein
MLDRIDCLHLWQLINDVRRILGTQQCQQMLSLVIRKMA